MSDANTMLTTPSPATTNGLLAARNVMKYFGDDRRPVLEHVSVELHEGEFVALLGPSGSGKSTLLRILAGLMEPSSGEVLVHGSPLEGTNPNVAIVFQSFALFPWLDVLQNVELGLLAMEVPEEERRRRATKAIDLIGLDGYEEAFPKELSGGMKQRVGFARALVVQPEVLFMDEPFSALDVLTAENLRTELQDLWLAKTMPTKAVVMVTHNIDEAVSLADRILVFGANPGHIRVELKGLPPADRTAKSAPRARLVELIYRIMTNPEDDAVSIVEQSLQGRTRPLAPRGTARAKATRARRYQVLPDVSIDDLTGLVQYIGASAGTRRCRISRAICRCAPTISSPSSKRSTSSASARFRSARWCSRRSARGSPTRRPTRKRRSSARRRSTTSRCCTTSCATSRPHRRTRSTPSV